MPKLIDLIATASPWLAPVPTAWVIAAAAAGIDPWPLPNAVAWVLGAALEFIGISASLLVLELRSYNRTRRKSDQPAPTWLAAVVLGFYIVVTIIVTVVLEIVPGLDAAAPGMLPLLSLAAFGVLAIRQDHANRLQQIAEGKAREKAERAARKKPAKAVAKPKYQCKQCGEPFENRHALSSHARWKHPKTVALDLGGNGYHAKEIEHDRA